MSSFLHFFPTYNLVFSNFSVSTRPEEKRGISTSFLICGDASIKKFNEKKKTGEGERLIE